MRKVLSLTLVACATLTSWAGKNFEITTSGENLMTLTKVTDNEEPCMNPYGGNMGLNLFFAARENKKYWNIYKKEKMLNRVLLTSSIGGENDKHNEGSRRSGKARK